MNNKVLSVLVALLLTCLFSCQEKYDDPSIKSATGMIVVKGLITDAEGPYSVYVSHTIPFNDKEPTVYADALGIEGAEVIISDDSGNSEVLAEAGKGNYVTSEGGIRGIAGNTYTLSVTTPDGNNYQSKPCLLRPAPEIVSVYPVNTEEFVLVNNLYGPPTLQKRQGVGIFADIAGLSDDDTFYRFGIRIIKETRWVSFMGPTVYCWTTTHIKNKKNLLVTDFLAGDSIIKHHVAFLTPDAFPGDYQQSWAVTLYLDGRIVALDIYALSREIYDYYSIFYNQLSAENRIFDPVPTNLTGNMYCKNDPSQTVLGIFEASGKSYMNCLVKFNAGNPDAMYQDAGYMPLYMGHGCQEDNQPDFYKMIGY
jgi:hypothetical protein